MKQRLGIAGALLSDPKLLLLDEPANGLDPAGIVAMRDTLRHLASTGKTVFVSSHLLGEVQPAGRRGRDHRRRQAGPRGTDRGAAGDAGPWSGSGSSAEADRAVAALAALGDGSRLDVRDDRPSARPTRSAGWRSRSSRAGPPRSTGRWPRPGSTRPASRVRQRPRVALPRADRGRWRARGHVRRGRPVHGGGRRGAGA